MNRTPQEFVFGSPDNLNGESAVPNDKGLQLI